MVKEEEIFKLYVEKSRTEKRAFYLFISVYLGAMVVFITKTDLNAVFFSNPELAGITLIIIFVLPFFYFKQLQGE